MKKNKNLVIRSAFTIALMVFFLIAIYTAFFYIQLNISSEKEFMAKGKALSDLFALTCPQAITENDVSVLSGTLLKLAQQAEVRWVAVYGLNGDIIASHTKDTFNIELSEEFLSEVESKYDYVVKDAVWDFYSPITVAGEDFLESIEEEKIGYVRIGLTPQMMEATQSKILKTGMIFGFISLIAGIIVSILMARGILRPVLKMADEIDSIGTDLKKRVTLGGEDEVGKLAFKINGFIDTLSAMIREIKTASPKIHMQAQELASVSEELTAASEEITSSVQQIALSSGKQLEDINNVFSDAKNAQMIARETVEVALRTKEFSDRTLNLSSEGKNEAEEASSKSEMIVKSVEILSERINTLVIEIEQVPKIIDTINSISKKTSILSLNAMIEAARAGESGRGFAVVAQEIAKLADMSRSQAEEIGKIVTGVIDKTSSMVKEADNTNRGILESREIFLNASTRLKIISEQMEKAGVEINAILKKGKINEESVNRLVLTIDKVAEESQVNAAAAQEVSAAVEEQSAAFSQLTDSTQLLSELADHLKQLVEKF